MCTIWARDGFTRVRIEWIRAPWQPIFEPIPSFNHASDIFIRGEEGPDVSFWMIAILSKCQMGSFKKEKRWARFFQWNETFETMETVIHRSGYAQENYFTSKFFRDLFR